MGRYTSITTYNLSKGIQELFYYSNDATRSVLSNGILLAIFTIAIVTVYNYTRDIFEGFAIASFITLLTSVFFWVSTLISGITLAVVIVISIVSFALLWINKRGT